MTKQETIKRLEALDACEEAVEWAQDQKDFEAIIKNCDRGDWLFWLGGKVLSSRELAIPKAEVAETVLHLFERKFPDDDRPRKAIEAAKQYGRGEIDAAAARAARAAAADAAAAFRAASDAAFAAAFAAFDASGAARDAAAAANASAVVDYADASSRNESLKKSANIFRSHFSVGYLEKKFFAEKYAQQLRPASSPEELEVWVDGEYKGVEPSFWRTLVGWDDESGDYATLTNHIQLINSDTGLVVMDNCEMSNNEDQ
jgi:hypothetical protein